MMMKSTKIISIIFATIVLTSASKCEFTMEDNKYPWYVMNQANYSIKSYLAFGYYDFSPTAYPDTILPINNHIGMNNVESNEKQLVWESVNKEDLIKSLPLDTLSVFIFHADTLDKYTWEEVRDNYKILVRYDLSLQNLQLLNYTITYPPDERMKNMKMYPPYE
jgi:hypothetical protein